MSILVKPSWSNKRTPDWCILADHKRMAISCFTAFRSRLDYHWRQWRCAGAGGSCIVISPWDYWRCHQHNKYKWLVNKKYTIDNRKHFIKINKIYKKENGNFFSWSPSRTRCAWVTGIPAGTMHRACQPPIYVAGRGANKQHQRDVGFRSAVRAAAERKENNRHCLRMSYFCE